MPIELLRHGDTGQSGFRGQRDDALSALGWSQLRAAVQGRAWDAIVSSPLKRCAAFARVLARKRQVPLRIDARLAEYHFGLWQDQPLDWIATHHGDALTRFWADPVRHPPPGGETFAAFHERLSTALDQVKAESIGRRVLIITHAGVIRQLRCRAEGRSDRDMACMEVPHASLHRLSWPAAVSA